MRLQYQLANGNWIDCSERSDEFLDRCVRMAGGDRNAVLAALAAGQEVRNAPNDWHSNCRDGEVFDRKAAERRAARDKAEKTAKPLITCRICKQTGRSGEYPFSTLPGDVCDDCV